MQNPAPLSDRPVLVGRDREQQALLNAASNLSAGRGVLVLIGGEAGIGKTALVEDFLPRISPEDALVVTGASYDIVPGNPYAPWREALDSIPRVSGSNGGIASWDWSLQADQSGLFSEVRRRLLDAAGERPLIVVLEDLHWADRESIDLLRFVSRSVSQSPLLIIGTYRSEEVDATLPLPDLVREARAIRIDLGRFTAEPIRQLLNDRYRLDEGDLERLVGYLAYRTEGNPFFVVELLRSLEMADVLTSEDAAWRLGSLAEIGVPLLVRQVIERRMLRLDDEARNALRVAAVLGNEVRPEEWLASVDLDEPALARVAADALDAHLLEQSPDGKYVRFRHALVRETIYNGLPLPWRQTQHRRIASRLAESGSADPALVASHFRHGADERASWWLLQAARRARHLYAPHAVIQHIDAALAMPGSLTTAECMDAYRLRGWAYEIAGEFDAALHDFLEALALARRAEAGHAEWECLIHLAELWAGVNYERTGDYVQQALEHAEAMADDVLRAHSLNRLGNWHLNAERPGEARRYHHQALEIFQRIDDQSGIAASYDLLGIACYVGGDLIEGTDFYQRAIEHFRTLDDRQGLSSSLANLAMRGGAYQTDTMVPPRATLDDCIDACQQSLAIAREIDWKAGEAYASIELIACCGARGAYQTALDESGRSIALADGIGHRQWLTAASCNAGLLAVDMLDPALALRYLQRARAVADETRSRNWILCSSAKLALAHLLAGSDDEAESELRSVGADDLPSESLGQRLVWRARIELELFRGNPDVAIDLIDRMLAVTPHASAERPPVRLAMLRGQALIATSRFDEAEWWLSAAHRVAGAQGARASLWRIQRDLGIAHTGRRQRLAASSEFSEARRLIREIAATIDDETEQERYRRSALAQLPESWTPTTLQAATQSAGGLTRRQREVAALIAAGSSNLEIADELSISERTVESHAASILARLNLSTRTQVAAWAVQHGLVDHPR